jgi:hypothetical protein
VVAVEEEQFVKYILLVVAEDMIMVSQSDGNSQDLLEQRLVEVYLAGLYCEVY